MKRLALISAAALVACGGPPKPKDGTAEFRFTVGSMVRNSANLKDPLVGTVHGAIFLVEDVSITGPHDGAMHFEDVTVSNVDLRTEMTSTANFITKGLAPNTYVFLGFMDLDANGDGGDPDPGDPATLALTNKFEVTEEAQVKRVVLFEILYN